MNGNLRIAGWLVRSALFCATACCAALPCRAQSLGVAAGAVTGASRGAGTVVSPYVVAPNASFQVPFSVNSVSPPSVGNECTVASPSGVYSWSGTDNGAANAAGTSPTAAPSIIVTAPTAAVGVVNWTETAKTTFNTPPAANGSGPTCTPVPGQGSATVYYIVVGTFAGILIPDDDFAGRSLVRVGVGETGGINGSGGLRVVLGPGTTLASLTPLTWSITSGAGFITVANSPANDGTGTFTAAGAGGPVVLTLTSTSTGKSVPYNVTVTPPTGAYQVTASQGKWHGDCSAFMRNYTYLLPKDVSFWMTQGNE